MYTGGRSPTFPPTNAAADGALKGIFAKVFDLSISIACFIAHIFYAVYAQNSAQHARLFGFTQMAKGAAFVCVSVCIFVCVSCGVEQATLARAEEKPQCGTLCALKFPQVPFIPERKSKVGGKRSRERSAQMLAHSLFTFGFSGLLFSREGGGEGALLSVGLFSCIFPPTDKLAVSWECLPCGFSFVLASFALATKNIPTN